MDYTLLTNAFDLFVDCYVYGSIGYVLVIFLLHSYLAVSTTCKEPETVAKADNPDFYTQFEDLLNPAIEESFQPSSTIPTQLNFEQMTIRELRTHIRSNQLHDAVRSSLGKTISNARKSEFINSLQAI